MTRDVVVGCWCAVGALLAAAQLLAMAARSRFASFAGFLRPASSTVWGRLALLLGWMFIGWHFFAR